MALLISPSFLFFRLMASVRFNTPLPNDSLFFFFNDTATTEIYTLSLHDALPISCQRPHAHRRRADAAPPVARLTARTHPQHARRRKRVLDSPGDSDNSRADRVNRRSEEHTSELQSLTNLVCRLLLEKKKKKNSYC